VSRQSHDAAAALDGFVEYMRYDPPLPRGQQEAEEEEAEEEGEDKTFQTVRVYLSPSLGIIPFS
jgi:hypothetical protein